MSSVVTNSGAGVLAFRSTVVVDAAQIASKINLFGSATTGVSAGNFGVVPSGTHTLSIKKTAGTDGTGAIASLVISDVNDGSVAKAIAVDFAGLTYCSLNSFQTAAGLKVMLPGSADSLMLYRDASIGLFQIESSAAATWDISVNSHSTSAPAPEAASAGFLFRALETVDPNGAAPLTWSSAAPVRPLDILLKGNQDATLVVDGTNAVELHTDGTDSTLKGFNLKVGYYRIEWRVAGFGVDKFQSWLQVESGTVAVDQSGVAGNSYIVGTPAYSASTSSSALAYSVGSAVIQVTSAAFVTLKALAASSNPIQGRGNLNNSLSVLSAPLATPVQKDILSEVTIQVLSA
jgi:hypothetical protein